MAADRGIGKIDPDGLTPRQRFFVDLYFAGDKEAGLEPFNATGAYQQAYGCARDTANANGSRLLAQPEIQAAIARRSKAISRKSRLTQERLLRELEYTTLSNLADYKVTADGEVTVKEGVPQGAMRAISAIKRKTHVDSAGNVTHEVDIKLWDKVGSIQLAMKHLGMLKEHVEHDLSNDFRSLVSEAMQIAQARRGGGK